MAYKKRIRKDGTITYEFSVKVNGHRYFKTFENFNQGQKWVDSLRHYRNQGIEKRCETVTIEKMFEAYWDNAL